MSPSFSSIRISVFFLTVAILAGCLEQPEASIPGAPEPGIAAAAKRFQTQYDTLVREDGQVVFPPIDERLFADESYRLFAVVGFKGGAKFDRKHLRLALNGIRARHEVDFDLTSDSEWELEGPQWQLVVDLSRLRFRKNQSLLKRIAKVQADGGSVELWVSSPKKVSRVELRFTRTERPRTRETLPRVIFDRIQYGSSAFFHRVGYLYFHADSPVRGFECSLNYHGFRPCSSPASYWLRPGYHVFRARAISLSGRRGPIMTHHFRKHWHSEDVRITSIDPSESPTPSTSIAVSFQTRSNPPWFIWEWILKLAYKARCQGSHANLKACQWLKDQIYGGNWGGVAECQLDGQGFFPCKSPVRYDNLNEGSHTVVVRSLQNSSDADEYSWIVDRKHPSMAWVETPPLSTSETVARFVFEADEEVDTFCSFDGSAFSACDSPQELRNLVPGSHKFSIYGTDMAGNRSELLEYVWQVDNGVPLFSLTHVSPAEPLTASRQIRFDFEANEPARFFCFVDEPVPPAGSDLAAFECSSPLVLTELREGAHEVSFIAMDGQGNESEPVTHAWAIDATVPAVSLNLAFPLHVPTSQPDAQFVFSMNEFGEFRCRLDGTELGNCVSPFSVAELSEGTHTFSVIGRDTAGNEATSSFSWEVDATAPGIEITSITPNEPITESRTLEVSFTVSESAEVLCELDGGGQELCASPYLINELAEGDHELIISAADPAGNYSEITHEWTVTSPVVVSLDSVTPPESPTISPDAVFEFSANNAESFECALDEGGFEACTSPMAYTRLADGEHRFQVRGISLMGDAGEAVSYSWSIDSTPLQITQVSVSQISKDSALVTWTTNVPSDSRVQYGIGNLTSVKSDTEMTTSHVVVLQNLQSNSLYSFQVFSEDAWSRVSESEVQTFRTLR